MHILKTFCCHLWPSPDEKARMRFFAGCCRYVWNRALALQQEMFKAEGHRLDYYGLASHLKAWKKEADLAFLNEAQSQILQQTLWELHRASKVAATTPAPAPGFHKKRLHNSFRYPQGFKVDEAQSRLYLPKIGWIQYQASRPLQGKPKQVTVSCVNGQWFAAILTESVVEKPKHACSNMVGIDTATADCIALLSDGSSVALTENIRQYEEHLIRLRRQLHRRQAHSRRWGKQSLKVQQQYAKIMHACTDLLHKATNDISKKYAVAVLEEGAVTTATAQRYNANDARAALHESLLTRAKAEFRRQLEYKMLWRGGKILCIPLSKEEKATHRTAAGLLALAQQGRTGKLPF